MEVLNIWDNLDERAFYENTMILELVERSQGISSMSIAESDYYRDSNDHHGELKWVSDFVDDFALIAAGSGGASNVTAACLEREDFIPCEPTIALARLREYSPTRSCTPTTLPPPINPQTPLTIRTLQRQGEQLQNADLSPTFWRLLDVFVKCSMTMAIGGNLAIDGLTHTQAAEQARKLRQKQSKRSIQKGGVVYAHESRKMVKERKEEEIGRAKLILVRAEAKKARKQKTDSKALLKLVNATRRSWTKIRTDAKKQRRLICREIERTAEQSRLKSFR